MNEIKYKQKDGKNNISKTWKLTVWLLSNSKVREKVSRNFRKYFEPNKNKNTTY